MRFVIAIALLAPFAAHAADSYKTDDEKSLYAIGYIVGSRNLQALELKPAELKIVLQGITDATTGKKAVVDTEAQMPKINTFAKARASAGADKEKKDGLEVAEKAAKESGAEKVKVDDKTWFVKKTLTPGNGASPAPTDTVNVDYEGKLISGTVFDSSYKRGTPAEFGLNQVIKCWTLGVAKMKVGEKAQLVCPSDVAYGDNGHPPTIPGGATLVFTVELHSIKGK